jgi:hypothetical protein
MILNVFIKGVAHWGLIPRPLGRLLLGVRGFVPPYAKIFQGGIFDTAGLALRSFIFVREKPVF